MMEEFIFETRFLYWKAQRVMPELNSFTIINSHLFFFNFLQHKRGSKIPAVFFFHMNIIIICQMPVFDYYVMRLLALQYFSTVQLKLNKAGQSSKCSAVIRCPVVQREHRGESAIPIRNK